MSISIKLDAFEGPLDLLLHLITVNKVDIYDIPIHQITDAYISFIEEAAQLDINIAGEFMVMSATLLEIKSRMLLPYNGKDGDAFDYLDADPRSELTTKLLEYRKFKSAADMLYQRESLLGSVYHRDQEDLASFIEEDELCNQEMETKLLMEAMRRLVMAIPEKDEHRASFFKTLRRDLFTVESKLDVIRQKLRVTRELRFESLFEVQPIKEEVIVTFIALLELLKTKEIKVVQEALFSEIIIMGMEIKTDETDPDRNE